MKKTRIVWTNKEKELIVRTAVDLRKKRPDLVGMSLFREALYALPVSRRRRIRALTLVPWFVEGVEGRTRESVRKWQRLNVGLLNKILRVLTTSHAEVVKLLGEVLSELRRRA